MCLIAIAPPGTSKYSKFFLDALECGASTNKDGIGIAWRKGGSTEIKYKKGIKNEDYVTEIKKLGLIDEDTLIVHFRYISAGTVTKENCHPFVLSRKQEEILSLEGIAKEGLVFHNGTMEYYTTDKSKFSDTYHFVKKFMCIKEIQDILKRDTEEFTALFSSRLNSGRFAFMFPTKDIYLGDFIKDEGYIFSNIGYKDCTIINKGGENISMEEDLDAFQPKVSSKYKKPQQKALPPISLSNCFASPLQKDEIITNEDPPINKTLHPDIPVLENNYASLYFFKKHRTNNISSLLEGGCVYKISSWNSDCGFHIVQNIKDVGYSCMALHSNLITECTIYVDPKSHFLRINSDFKRLVLDLNSAKKAYKQLKRKYYNQVTKKGLTVNVYSFRGKTYYSGAVSLFLDIYAYKFDGGTKIEPVFKEEDVVTMYD